MAKKKGKRKRHEAAGQASPTAERQDGGAGPPARMERGVDEGEVRGLPGGAVGVEGGGERERSQVYVQRYLGHLPAGGEVVIFDRSWYNRAGVEPVMGFCTPAETERFLGLVPAWEKAMTDSGIVLVKYWLEVS